MPVQFLTTNNISNTSQGDSTNPPALAGKAGEAVVAELHGKWYTAAYRSRVFLGNTAAAGSTIPIVTTTVPTFALYNPLGSGVNVELISVDIGNTVTTWVASPILLALVSGANAVPVSVTTALTPYCSNIGSSGVSQARLYASVAMTTAFSTGANYFPLFNISAISGVTPVLHYDFDGKIILPPGSAAALLSTAAQTAPTSNGFAWAEFPI